MTAKKNPLYSKYHAWYDMTNSTSYKTSTAKQLVDTILQHPCSELVKPPYIFTALFDYFMKRDVEIALLPYNQAVFVSRERALNMVLVILNEVEVTLELAKS